MSRRSNDGPPRIVIPFHPARKAKSCIEPSASSDQTSGNRRVNQQGNPNTHATAAPGDKGPALRGNVVAAGLAHLSEEERHASERALDFYRYVGKPESEVASLAWSDLQLAYPRLQEYAGAEDESLPV